MVTKVSVNIPDNLYQRTQRFAHRHQQETDEVISALIEEGLAAREADDKSPNAPEPDSAVARERQAYIAMHPQLKQEYLGKYVAVYHGELIDYDDDPAVLRERTSKKYPGEFILLTRVGSESMRTIDIRSPRFARDTMA